MNTLLKIYLLLIFTFCSFTAMAQNHAANQARLNEQNQVIKQLRVLNNAKAQLPIVGLSGLKIASVDLDFQYKSVFDSIANKFAKITALTTSYEGNSTSSINLLNDDLKLYNCAILKTSKPLTPELINLIKELERSKKVILVISGNYPTAAFNSFRSPVVISPSQSPIAASCLAQLIFGAIVPQGKAIRLKYTVPEEVGINIADLDSIPLIVNQAITAKGAPGAVVMIVKDGKVIFNEAYGKHTYNGNREMRIQDIFDMASVTKIAATTATTMDLYEKGKININNTIGTYIARTRAMPEKKTITVKEVLLHQAGFYPYIKFYEQFAYLKDCSISDRHIRLMGLLTLSLRSLSCSTCSGRCIHICLGSIPYPLTFRATLPRCNSWPLGNIYQPIG